MRQDFSKTRRQFIAGLAGAAAALPVTAHAQSINLIDGSDEDQTAVLQEAIDNANGRLALPAGRFRVSRLRIPSNTILEGVPGATWLVASGNAAAGAEDAKDIVLRDIGFAGDSGKDPLFGLGTSRDINFERCQFRDSPGIALSLYKSTASVRDCSFAEHGDAAIHALDCRDLQISGNRIAGCGNAGIRVWQSQHGTDGSIVTNNHITRIDWRGGGNGQNGNGINVYLADEVIVSDNHITDCAFTAVRLNTTRNTVVTGNQCRTCGEVAIFSEFGFSGSIIADNLIDDAATGISITNLDTDGHLAICANNIVRNISRKSAVNPDTMPVGILAEAETVVTGNLVSNVPGVGIAAGWGQFLRNVSITDNQVHDSFVGIGISVADGAGAVLVSGNQVSGERDGKIVGLKWRDIAERDLEANAGRYSHVTVR